MQTQELSELEWTSAAGDCLMEQQLPSACRRDPLNALHTVQFGFQAAAQSAGPQCMKMLVMISERQRSFNRHEFHLSLAAKHASGQTAFTV